MPHVVTSSATAETAELRHRLNAAYGGLGGEDLLHPLITRVFHGRIALVSSFGTESAVLLHMVASIDRRTPVIFLNTGKLFGQTLAYREALVERLGLTDIRDVRPDPLDVARSDPAGDLWNLDGNACCWIRKVLPLRRALDGFSAWITGRKRHQGGARGTLATFETDGERIKVNPLAAWSPEQLRRYAADNDLPEHPLLGQGYASVGCGPCTVPSLATGDPRSGRWADTEKTECGIHVGEDGAVMRTAHQR